MALSYRDRFDRFDRFDLLDRLNQGMRFICYFILLSFMRV
jgi:hypothetical protein